MKYLARGPLCLFLLLVACALPLAAASTHSDAYANLPLAFEKNDGQAAAPVQFLSRGHGYSLFLTPQEAVVRLTRKQHDDAVVRWRTAGGNANPRVAGQSPLASKSNYFHGNDPSQWRTNVANFGAVRYEGVYRGIDLVYHGNQRKVEYDFVVAPGANPKQIRVAFDGIESMKIDGGGNLVLHTANGDLVQARPNVYQDVDGQRRTVAGRYARTGAREVGFVLGKYDRTRQLVIDPTLLYSTFLGGSDIDIAGPLALDSSGNVYVTGFTGSSTFPGVSGSSLQPSNGGDWDIFLIKINAAGTAIVYSTYLGGDGGNESGETIAIDSSGNAYVAGSTNSSNFPGVTGSSIQSTFGGYWRDGFVAKINAAGNAILWSTYLGGSGDDLVESLAVDGSGNTTVVGATSSTSFPGVGGSSLQSTYGGGPYDGFVTKIDASGGLIYSTFLGGNDDEYVSNVVLDASGNAIISGSTASTSFPGVTGSSLQSSNAGSYDGFLTKINAAGTAITWSTFLGGSDSDDISGLALDSSGNIVIAGNTSSTSFPGVTGSSLQSTNAGNGDVYLAKLNSSASAISRATFLGGNDVDFVSFRCLTLDASDNPYITGGTLSTTFTGIDGTSIQPSNAGSIDSFVAELNAAGSAISWATFLGGSGDDVAVGIQVDGSGNVYVAGRTTSTSFPGVTGASIQPTYGGGDYDGFLTKFGTPGTPTISSISPTTGRAGDTVTILGSGFGAPQGSGNVWLGSKYGNVVSWANTQVVATIASGATSGVAQILQGGVWSNQISLTVVTPNITSITPTSGVAGDQITINGTGFGVSQGSGNVWLGSKNGTVVSWSDTQVVATIASGATSGVAQIYQGGVWSNQISLTVVTPNITSISPTSGVAGTSVTINGTGFQSAQGSGSVWLGSKAGTVVSWSDTQIVATIASGATSGVAQVYQGGVWSNQISLTVITPNITSISPTTAYSGDQITVTGTGFGTSQGSGAVWLGSTYGTVVSWSDTQIVASVASGATSGVAQVLQGGVWSNQISLTVVTPHITSISPTHGTSGTQVTITGTGFRSSQGSGSVWLGSTYGTVVSWSDTQIVASVAGSAASGVAQVYQGGVWSNQISFSVP